MSETYTLNPMNDLSDLVEYVERLYDIIMDSSLPFEKKMDYAHDKPFSLSKTVVDLKNGNFDGAIDKLGGLKASIGMDTEIDDILIIIEHHWVE